VKPNRTKAVEVLSLNREFMQFDPAQLDVEQLERRLELALAAVARVGLDAECPVHCMCYGQCGLDCPNDCLALILEPV
jgi:hypothetical protein